MKRKSIVIWGFMVLIIFSLFFIFFVLKDNGPQTQHEPKESPSQPEDKKDETPENTEEKKDEKEETESNQKVRDIISDVVQRTVDFFSTKDANIVAVGDSLTQGVGDEEDAGGYIGIIDQTINESEQLARIQNFGKHGDRTDQLLTKLHDPRVATSISNADIILITIGANDIMKIVKENITHLTYSQFVDERADYEERLRDIFERIDSLNEEAAVYLVGFYNPFSKYFPEIDELELIVDDWNKIGKEVTADYEQATYIPTKDLFENTHVDLFSDDNFHPNHKGYERMAKRVLNYLTRKDR